MDLCVAQIGGESMRHAAGVDAARSGAPDAGRLDGTARALLTR